MRVNAPGKLPINATINRADWGTPRLKYSGSMTQLTNVEIAGHEADRKRSMPSGQKRCKDYLEPVIVQKQAKSALIGGHHDSSYSDFGPTLGRSAKSRCCLFGG